MSNIHVAATNCNRRNAHVANEKNGYTITVHRKTKIKMNQSRTGLIKSGMEAGNEFNQRS